MDLSPHALACYAVYAAVAAVCLFAAYGLVKITSEAKRTGCSVPGCDVPHEPIKPEGE